LGIAQRVRILARTVSGADKHRLYQSARVFALPSHSENFGNTVLEAMDAGLPVVLTPEVGAADIVKMAGAGIIAAGEPGAFAAALDRFLADEAYARTAGESGRSYVRQNCSWGAAAAAMEALYKEAMANGH
jgi:glycosyltransferase involved in cell wall biosynthesis